MAVYKTVSSKVVIRKIFRDLKPSKDNWIDDAIEWIGEALEHIGAAPQLCQKQCVLDIKDHKTLMPSDLYYINQVAINNSVSPVSSTELDTLTKKVTELKAQIVAAQADGLEYSSTTSALNEINSRIVVLENVYFASENNMHLLQYGASTFHKSMHCDGCVNENASYEETYIVDCGYIKTSFESGKICISYMAMPTDEECYPLVPADISYQEAMFWYVYKQILLSSPKFKNNGIDYNFADQKWKYYCTQARNAANFPDIDRMESFMNQWVRLIPSINSHDAAFENLNTRENLYRS
jgi:hypothetical protein|tara:strand:- start:13004 stop:13888 length:885 start_codon:yes stop_codon:yes gene_type:complete